jgi:hypothetical protein
MNLPDRARPLLDRLEAFLGEPALDGFRRDAAERFMPGGGVPEPEDALLHAPIEVMEAVRRRREDEKWRRAELRRFREAARAAASLENEDGGKALHRESAGVDPDRWCPCGSGKKYKHCCGRGR